MVGTRCGTFEDACIGGSLVCCSDGCIDAEVVVVIVRFCRRRMDGKSEAASSWRGSWAGCKAGRKAWRYSRSAKSAAGGWDSAVGVDVEVASAVDPRSIVANWTILNACSRLNILMIVLARGSCAMLMHFLTPTKDR